MGGFSQGSMLMTDLTLRHDGLPAGLVIFSGSVMAREEWLSMMREKKDLAVVQVCVCLQRARQRPSAVHRIARTPALRAWNSNQSFTLLYPPSLSSFSRHSRWCATYRRYTIHILVLCVGADAWSPGCGAALHGRRNSQGNVHKQRRGGVLHCV